MLWLIALPPQASETDPKAERPRDPEPRIAREARLQAEQDYALHCSPCHGVRGGGDGLLAAKLTPSPARLADPALLESRSDEELFRAIELGIPAPGESEGMAAWGDTLAPEQIRALVAFIRTLQRDRLSDRD
jgi:mono/diheme cytochrome c family protein